jgi:hypothetical protein
MNEYQETQVAEQTMKPISGAEKAKEVINNWRNRTYTTLKLNSGVEVIVRKPRSTVYIKARRMPLDLTQKVAEAKASPEQLEIVKEEIRQEAESDESKVLDFVYFAKVMVEDVLVVPRAVIPEPGKLIELEPDQVFIDDIPEEDFQQIYTWACNQKLNVGETEVTAEEARNFRRDATVSNAGGDV